MKLHSPGFESALRRGVREEIRKSAELRREFKRAKKFRKNSNLAWLMRLCWAFAPAVAAWRVAEITGHLAAGIGIVTLWSTSLAFASANNLILFLFRANDIPALAMLPVSESLIFRWELWRFLRRSLFSLVDLLACYGALAAYAHATTAGWLGAVALAVLAWMMVLALAGLLTARMPRFPYPLVPFGIAGGAIVCFYTYKATGAFVIHSLDAAAPMLNLILPSGWAPSQIDLLASGWNWGTAVLLLPIALVISTVPASLRILRGRYLFHEPTVPQPPDLIPANDAVAAALAGRDGTIPSSPPGLTAIEEIVRTHLFQAEPGWPKSGTAEGFLWRWLTRRERVLAEFAFPCGLIITRRWKSLARNFAIMLALAILAAAAGPMSKISVVGVGLFVTLCQMLNVGFTTGAGFRSLIVSGVRIPLYAGFPVGYLETSRLLLKYTAVQLPFLALFTTAAAVEVAWLGGFSLPAGGLAGFKLAFLVVSARCIHIVMAYGSSTNEQSRVTLRGLVMVACCLGLAVLFLALAGAGLFYPSWPLALGAWLLAMFEAYGLLRFYGWYYHRNRFDLMNTRPGR